MRREGRQHGMVRTYTILPSPWNPKPESRFINKFDSPPTAGLFTKVSSKPTNHSKFTGKCDRPRCAECHEHPASKSKGKAKGTHKKMTSWRVVDGQSRFSFGGVSATGVLDYMVSDYYLDDNDNYDEEEVYDFVSDVYEGSDELVVESLCLKKEIQVTEVDEINNDGDDDISFCVEGFVLDHVDGNEGWCLVGKM